MQAELSISASILKSNTEQSSHYIHRIWKQAQQRMDFIGFHEPCLGAIVSSGEIQVQLWVMSLVATHNLVNLESEDKAYYIYRKSNDRTTYGVDHESNVYQLTLNMYSAYALIVIFRNISSIDFTASYHLLIICNFGADSAPSSGPYKPVHGMELRNFLCLMSSGRPLPEDSFCVIGSFILQLFSY